VQVKVCREGADRKHLKVQSLFDLRDFSLTRLKNYMLFIHIRFRSHFKAILLSVTSNFLSYFFSMLTFNMITLSVTGKMADGCVALKTTEAARIELRARQHKLRV
jgi:hypothetical protein